MALIIPKREDIKIKSNLVIPARGVSEEKAKNVREVGFPENMGGGRYLISDKSGELIKSPRSQSALPSIGTAERDHIISVALGGTSGRDNLQYLATTKEGRQEGKVSVEQKAINDYVSGKISLGEARLAVQMKQLQIKDLAPEDKEMTWQGQIGNVIKDAVKNVFKPLTKESREEAKKYGAYGKEVLTEKAKSIKEVTGEDIKPEKVVSKIKTLNPEQQQALSAKSAEKATEMTAKVVTAPIRFTAGSLATGLVSYGLEKADSDGKFTPKTEAEKLLIGESEIQRLLKQEDLYGTIARGAGVPVALLLMAVIESPFISGTGASKLVKEAIEKQIKQLSAEQLAKLGTKEITKLANGVIRAEQKAGKLTTQQAEQAVKELSNIKVVENVEQPKLVIPERTVEPSKLDPKNFKTAEDYVKAQNVVYHGTDQRNIDALNKNGVKILSVEDKIKLPSTGGGNYGISMTTDKATAQNYSQAFGNKNIGEFYINPNAKIKNITGYIDDVYTPDQIEKLAKQGYDVIKSTAEESEVRILTNNGALTKSQLISEWNKAQKAPELKYEPTIAQPSVPNRIKNEAIEKGLKVDFKGIDEYDKVSFKDQAKLVGDIVDEDPEKAIRIALGQELPKNGALPESIFIAVKNQAIKNGDTDLLIRLATEEGGVAKESTVLGQRIKMLDEQLEDDAFRNINEVVKARRGKLEKSGISIPKAKKAEVDKIKIEIAKAKPVKDEWVDFIKSITC